MREGSERAKEINGNRYKKMDALIQAYPFHILLH